jgi:hypothetical protein
MICGLDAANKQFYECEYKLIVARAEHFVFDGIFK